MFEKYVVEENDNITLIAQKFNTDIQFLKDINNLPYADQFYRGKEIVVPIKGPDYYFFKKNEQGDTLYNIAQKYNINPELLANLNGMERNDYIYKDQELLIPKSGYSYYITKEGDTLDTVSDLFGIKKEILLNDNHIIYLLSGQMIVYKNK